MAKLHNMIAGAVVTGGVLSTLLALRRKNQRYDFKNKVVLITGGSRGSGLVLAREFGKLGARLAICGPDLNELDRARKGLEASGIEVFDAVCDVTDQKDVTHLMQDIQTRYGRLDIVINNAGRSRVGPFEPQTPRDLQAAMAAYFWGPYNVMKAAIPLLKKGGEGRIVNVTSFSGKVAVPHLAPYCASKFALVGLSSAMRAELAKDNILVTTVCPGLMRTGNYVKAPFRGQNEFEYALFSLADAPPLTSASAETAARQIIRAVRKGEAGLVISLQAKLALKMHEFFPELTAEVFSLINRLLPGNGWIGKQLVAGFDSKALIPSFLAARNAGSPQLNNELGPTEQAA